MYAFIICQCSKHTLSCGRLIYNSLGMIQDTYTNIHLHPRGCLLHISCYQYLQAQASYGAIVVYLTCLPAECYNE